jgi:hypothetical protein
MNYTAVFQCFNEIFYPKDRNTPSQVVPNKHQANFSQYIVFSADQGMGKTTLAFKGAKGMFCNLLSKTVVFRITFNA